MYGNSPDVPRTALAPSTLTSFNAATRLRGMLAKRQAPGRRLLVELREAYWKPWDGSRVP